MSDQKREILTLKKLADLPTGAIIASGKVINSEQGIFITPTHVGRMMKWIAKKGDVTDWAIYIHWVEMDDEMVLSQGDKVRGTENIMKLVPCEQEVLKVYRY